MTMTCISFSGQRPSQPERGDQRAEDQDRRQRQQQTHHQAGRGPGRNIREHHPRDEERTLQVKI